MKFRHVLASATVALIALASSNAEAALFSTTNLGALTLGATGTITNAHSLGLNTDIVKGSIPSNSTIVFSYTFTKAYNGGLLGINGNYNYNSGGDHYHGSASSANGNTPAPHGFIGGSPSTALVLASSYLSHPTKTGTTSITNNSSDFAKFVSIFTGLMKKHSFISINYSVNGNAGASPVPLPAALPLFGTALLGLYGVKRRKNRKQV